ncbi:MAG TPA: DUF4229 domain-containing protein [Candidatus Nanopelagicales bacterium]
MTKPPTIQEEWSMSEPNPTPPPGAAPGPPGPIPHAGLRYGLLRIALLLVTGGALYLVGMRGWGLAFAAVLISAVLSFFVLLRPRQEAARNIEVALEHRQVKGRAGATHSGAGAAQAATDEDGPDQQGGPGDPGAQDALPTQETPTVASEATAPEPPTGRAQQQP